MKLSAIFLLTVSLMMIHLACTCTVPSIENGEIGRYDSNEEFKKVEAESDVDSGETLFFRCERNFLPIDSSEFVTSNRLEVTCNEDGTWSKDLQCKSTQCTEPPPPSENATPVIKSREHGYSIYYACNSKKALKTPGNVTCHLGSWIGTPPKCLNTQCTGPPPSSENATAVIKSREHGYSIYYTCNSRLDLKIPGNVTCHLGSWIGTPAQCLEQLCYTKDLNYPGLLTPARESFGYFESFEVTCESGYKRTSNLWRDRFVRCKEGSWKVSQNPCTNDTSMYVWDPLDTINTCDPNLNEVYMACGTNCELTCQNMRNPPKFPGCFTGCAIGCFCLPGLVRRYGQHPRIHYIWDKMCIDPLDCPAHNSTATLGNTLLP